jgi:hypothetical protein
MKTRLGTVLAVCFAFLLASSVMAEDKTLKKVQKGKKDSTDVAFAFPKGIELSAEQQQKVEALKKEFAARLEAAQKKVDSIMTPERKLIVAEAIKQAKTDGKKFKDLDLNELEALKLTAEEKQNLKSAKEELGVLLKEIQQKKIGLLTAEQQEGLKKKPKPNKTK